MVTGTTVEIAGALARWPRAEAWLRVGALLLLAALCVMPAAALEIGAAEESELKTGGVPIRVEADTRGDADGVIDAVIDIKAPPARVWSVMLDCEKAVRFLPALTSCRVLETARDGASDVREHKSKWLAILPEMTSVFRSDYLPGREIRFSKVGGDMRVLKGAWRLEARADGKATRLRYHVQLGVNLPVPGFLLRGALEADVPKFLKALRAEAESVAPSHAPAERPVTSR